MKTTQEIFVENLVQIRKAKGLSQIRLAEEADVSTGMIGEIESGKRNPTLTTIDKIASALDTPVYQFFIDISKDCLIEGSHEAKKQLLLDLVKELV